jgi:polar amino acid transport system substrate-binding protein
MAERTGRSRLLVTLLLLAVLLPGNARAAEKPLRWGADEEGGAPYVFKDAEGKRVGFEVDLAQALARELGRPIEFKQCQFEYLIPNLLNGKIDFAMNGLEITEENRDQVRFSRPYYVYQQQLVVRKDEDRFSTLKGLTQVPGATVGTMAGTAAEALLKSLHLRTRSYDGPAEAYLDLAQKNVDAVYFDLAMALAYVKNNPEMERVLQFAGRPTARGYYAIAFRKEDKELADKVDAALGRLMKSGELRRIYKKWGIWNSAQEELMPSNLFEEDDKEETTAATQAPQGAVDYHLASYLPALLWATGVTVLLAVCSFALAVVVGLPIALARMYGPKWLRALAIAHIEFYRGVPVLLLLVFLYFGLPVIGESLGLGDLLRWPAFVVAVVGLGLNYSAYEAEIYRAAIQGIPHGQWEAAASLGMSRGLTFRRIILPQAIRGILPPMTGDFVAVFKDTSIASVITLVELNKEYQILARSSLKFIEIGLLTAALYLVMSVPLGYLSRYLEKRWSPAAA